MDYVCFDTFYTLVAFSTDVPCCHFTFWYYSVVLLHNSFLAWCHHCSHCISLGFRPETIWISSDFDFARRPKKSSTISNDFSDYFELFHEKITENIGFFKWFQSDFSRIENHHEFPMKFMNSMKIQTPFLTEFMNFVDFSNEKLEMNQNSITKFRLRRLDD